MRIFKAVKAVAKTVTDDVEVTYLMDRFGLTETQAVLTAKRTQSWELMLPEGHGTSVADEAALLDAYQAAVDHEGWRARMYADAGETDAGMLVIVGAGIGFTIFAAWFGAFVGVT